MLRKLFFAAVLAVLPAEFARAQYTGPIPGTGGFNSGYDYGLAYGWGVGRTTRPEESVQNYEIEQKYQETLRTRIPDKKPSNDPWKNVRQAPAAADRHKNQW